MNKIRIIVAIIASLGIVVAIVMLVTTYSEYKKANEEYEELVQSMVDTTPKSSVANEEKVEEAEEEKVKVLKQNYNRSDFPDMEVEHAQLKKKNPDYIGWLYVGSAGISYPVVQGSDNDYYLHHTFERENNFAGCIFIDCQDEKDFTKFNTFIYGHAMKNGSMFGNLRKLRKDSSLYNKDPYIYVYLEDGIYRYKIYSYYIDQKDSDMYYSSDTIKEYRQYIREALDKSMVSCGTQVSEEDNSVTLVTCQGTGSNKQRFFVHGIFIDRYLYK